MSIHKVFHQQNVLCRSIQNKTNGIGYLSMRFQLWSISVDSSIQILLRGWSVPVHLVVLNQGCYTSSQYNLPDKILRYDSNSTLNPSFVVFNTLVNIIGQHSVSPVIHSWDTGPWSVLYIPLALFFSFGYFYFFHEVLLIFNKIYFFTYLSDKFLIQVKVSFFSTLVDF